MSIADFFDRSPKANPDVTTAQTLAGLKRRFEELRVGLDPDAPSYGVRMRYFDDILDEYNKAVRGA